VDDTVSRATVFVGLGLVNSESRVYISGAGRIVEKGKQTRLQPTFSFQDSRTFCLDTRRLVILLTRKSVACAKNLERVSPEGWKRQGK